MPPDSPGPVRLEAPPAHALPPLPSPRALLLEHWAGRLLLGGALVRVLLALLGLAIGTWPPLETLRRLATATLIVGAAVVLWRVSRVLRQRLLWRVRRKLILSYFFIGVVPAALIFLFFLIVGALTLLSFSSYLVKEKLADLQAQGRVYADMAAVELQQARTPNEVRDLLTRKARAGARTYPGLSIALLPMNDDPRTGVLTVGAWDHGVAPSRMPGMAAAPGAVGRRHPGERRSGGVRRSAPHRPQRVVDRHRRDRPPCRRRRSAAR